MKIIPYLNSNNRHRTDIQTVIEKYILNNEEHDINQKSNTDARMTQNSVQQPPAHIEISNKTSAYIHERIAQKKRLKDSLVELIDREPQNAEFIDEEREAIRTETIRFF